MISGGATDRSGVAADVAVGAIVGVAGLRDIVAVGHGRSRQPNDSWLKRLRCVFLGLRQKIAEQPHQGNQPDYCNSSSQTDPFPWYRRTSKILIMIPAVRISHHMKLMNWSGATLSTIKVRLPPGASLHRQTQAPYHANDRLLGSIMAEQRRSSDFLLP